MTTPHLTPPAQPSGTPLLEQTQPQPSRDDVPAQRSGRQAAAPGAAAASTPAQTERWEVLLTHQARLRRLALSCGCPVDDARDVVHDALLRAAAAPQLDLHTAGAWLSVTVRHLVVDLHRHRVRQLALLGHHQLLPLPVAGPEDDVCDHAQGAWLHAQMVALTDRERQVMHSLAAGHTQAQTAAALHVSAKAVELALRRARRRLLALAAAVGVLAACATGLTRTGSPGAHFVATTCHPPRSSPAGRDWHLASPSSIRT